ncbi:MAG: penicillin acylase family protein [Xanthomonadales bacterium]|jgi:penicillin amidase|nr:penicillin acylase family protein [Xanthomonadales bacterium]
MKLLRRSLLLLLLLAGVALLLVWLQLRASLPLTTGTVTVPGLSAPLSIQRDALGTVVIEAPDRELAAFASGWVHAQERFFEMDLTRRRAAGELAALLGPALVDVDRKQRIHRLRMTATGTLRQLPKTQQQLLSYYTAGVNGGLAALSAPPFAYTLLRQTPEPWREADTLLVGLAMFTTLQDPDNRRERLVDEVLSHAPALAGLLLIEGSEWDTPLTGDPLPTPTLPGAEAIDLRTLDPALFEPLLPVQTSIAAGSNAFAVHGTRGAGGRALLAGDMHLGLGVPNIWFRQQLKYAREGRAVTLTGVALPGTPGIVAGSNGALAWGITNSYGDWLDFVRLTPIEGRPDDHYRDANAREHLLSPQQETIHVAGAEPVVLDVALSAYGPVVGSDAEGRKLALSWVAHRLGVVNLRFGDLDLAQSVAEGIEIARQSGIPQNNLIFADHQGRIGWTLAGRVPRRACPVDLDCTTARVETPYGLLPVRARYDPRQPVDSARLTYDVWEGWLDPEEVPALIDPAGGSIASGNQRKLDGPALDLIGYGGYDLGARARAIATLLEARPTHDVASLFAIQLSSDSALMTRWRDRIVARLAARGRADDAELLQRLGSAPLAATPDSVAYRLTREIRLATASRVMTGLAGPLKAKRADFGWPKLPQLEGIVWTLLDQRPAHLLAPRWADWDALFDEAIDTTVARLADPRGGLGARTWGEQNTLALRHPLSRALPILAPLLDLPAEPVPGDSFVPRAQGPAFGASQRLVVAPGFESEGILHMPGGQSGHPLSPWYGAGHAEWVQGRPVPLLPGAPVATLKLVPAG